jgi:hypothetical protein
MKTAALMAMVLALAGCAVGNQHAYTAETPQLSANGARPVAVGTEDARPYVVSRAKPPSFVGLSRGGFGNPFDVTTASGAPLADDFSATIARALQQKGFKSTVVDVGELGRKPDARALVSRPPADRLALITINEWKSDTFMQTSLTYEVTLRVYGAEGEQLATNRIAGRDNLGGDAINPPGHAKTAVPPAYRRKLEQLFDSEAVINSLR